MQKLGVRLNGKKRVMCGKKFSLHRSGPGKAEPCVSSECWMLMSTELPCGGKLIKFVSVLDRLIKDFLYPIRQ